MHSKLSLLSGSESLYLPKITFVTNSHIIEAGPGLACNRIHQMNKLNH